MQPILRQNNEDSSKFGRKTPIETSNSDLRIEKKYGSQTPNLTSLKQNSSVNQTYDEVYKPSLIAKYEELSPVNQSYDTKSLLKSIKDDQRSLVRTGRLETVNFK